MASSLAVTVVSSFLEAHGPTVEPGHVGHITEQPMIGQVHGAASQRQADAYVFGVKTHASAQIAETLESQ